MCLLLGNSLMNFIIITKVINIIIFFFDTRSCYIAQAGFELGIFLPLSPEFWSSLLNFCAKF